MKIDIHHALLWQRKLAVDRGRVPLWQRAIWRGWRLGMSWPALYRMGSAVARKLVPPAVMNWVAKPWTTTRDLQPMAAKTFRELWKESGGR